MAHAGHPNLSRIPFAHCLLLTAKTSAQYNGTAARSAAILSAHTVTLMVAAALSTLFFSSYLQALIFLNASL